MRLRRALHSRGLRYRVDYRPSGLRWRCDIAFTRAQVAVFVDGCFWHGCPEHSRPATTNSEYWSERIANNVARDLRAAEAYEAAGWTVLRVWEHESVADAVNAVEAALAVTARSGCGAVRK
jgi:DNA mismatch endonuclease, patch repair protein